MTLTEEQRAALKRVIAYMNRMYGIASPYHGCTEDSDLLRAMIDSSEHVTEPTKMIGFDLEKVKADLGDIGDPRFCDCEVRTQLAAAIAEIERLRADLEQAERVIEARLDVIEAQAIQIKALEDALAEYQRLGKIISESVIPCLTVHGNCDQCRPKTKAACEAIAAIRALSIILEYISYDADDDIEICSHAAVLRAMLREAE